MAEEAAGGSGVQATSEAKAGPAKQPGSGAKGANGAKPGNGSDLKNIEAEVERTLRAVNAASARVKTAKATLATAEAELTEATRRHAAAKTAAAEQPKKILAQNMDHILADPKLRKQYFALIDQAARSAANA